MIFYSSSNYRVAEKNIIISFSYYRVIIKEGHKVKRYYTAKICNLEVIISMDIRSNGYPEDSQKL